jgi:hypothetical protein
LEQRAGLTTSVPLGRGSPYPSPGQPAPPEARRRLGSEISKDPTSSLRTAVEDQPCWNAAWAAVDQPGLPPSGDISRGYFEPESISSGASLGPPPTFQRALLRIAVAWSLPRYSLWRRSPRKPTNRKHQARGLAGNRSSRRHPLEQSATAVAIIGICPRPRSEHCAESGREPRPLARVTLAGIPRQTGPTQSNSLSDRR